MWVKINLTHHGHVVVTALHDSLTVIVQDVLPVWAEHLHSNAENPLY